MSNSDVYLVKSKISIYPCCFKYYKDNRCLCQSTAQEKRNIEKTRIKLSNRGLDKDNPANFSRKSVLFMVKRMYICNT